MIKLIGEPQVGSEQPAPVAGRFLEISSAEYHADPCPEPSLSQTIAGELISRSPLHAWQIHPRLGAHRREGTKATTAGTVVHSLLLKKGEERIAVLDVPNFKTKVAQEARDLAIESGKCVVKLADFNEATDIAVKIKERLEERGIRLTGRSEEKIEFIEQTEDGPVYCRAALDHLIINADGAMSATIYDLKTCASATKNSVERSIVEYDYDIQEAAYRRAVQAVVPECAGRIDYVFLFCELEPPFGIRPVRLNGTWRLMGGLKWERACRTWARCLKTGKWPGYVDHIETIACPPWALTEEVILHDA